MSSEQRNRRWLKGWYDLSLDELVEAVRGIRTETELEEAMGKGLDGRIRELKRSIKVWGLQTEDRKGAILVIEEHMESLIGPRSND